MIKQQTITAHTDKGNVVSKPFDFEAMCLVNDMHTSSKEQGPLRMCRGAVSYMFEGTDCGEEELEKLTPAQMSAMCREVWDFYAEALCGAKK